MLLKPIARPNLHHKSPMAYQWHPPLALRLPLYHHLFLLSTAYPHRLHHRQGVLLKQPREAIWAPFSTSSIAANL